MTLLEQNALRDYADRAAKVKPERRVNWLWLTVACVVVAVIFGFLWRMTWI